MRGLVSVTFCRHVLAWHKNRITLPITECKTSHSIFLLSHFVISYIITQISPVTPVMLDLLIKRESSEFGPDLRFDLANQHFLLCLIY